MKKLSSIFITLIMLGTAWAISHPASAQKPYQGTAQGTLTVDGKTIPLRYSYVIEVNNVEEEGTQISSPTKYSVLVLSDKPLPQSSVSTRNAPQSELRSIGMFFAPPKDLPSQKIHGILLKLEPKKQAPYYTQLFHPTSDNAPMHIVGTEYADRVTNLKQQGNMLSGAAQLAHARSTGLEKGPKLYRYRATFRAPIVKEAAVTAKWEGAQALKNPVVKSIREYLVAGKKGDMATLQRLTAKTHLHYLKNPTYMKFLKSGQEAQLAEQVKRVVVRGRQAAVLIVSEEPNYSQTLMQLVNENGVWKLYWP